MLTTKIKFKISPDTIAIELSYEYTSGNIYLFCQKNKCLTWLVSLLQEHAHHFSPDPSIMPPPWIVNPCTLEDSSHTERSLGFHLQGSAGATILPDIC